jgi:hypothetical protein
VGAEYLTCLPLLQEAIGLTTKHLCESQKLAGQSLNVLSLGTGLGAYEAKLYRELTDRGFHIHGLACDIKFEHIPKTRKIFSEIPNLQFQFVQSDLRNLLEMLRHSGVKYNLITGLEVFHWLPNLNDLVDSLDAIASISCEDAVFCLSMCTIYNNVLMGGDDGIERRRKMLNRAALYTPTGDLPNVISAYSPVCKSHMTLLNCPIGNIFGNPYWNQIRLTNDGNGYNPYFPCAANIHEVNLSLPSWMRLHIPLSVYDNQIGVFVRSDEPHLDEILSTITPSKQPDDDYQQYHQWMWEIGRSGRSFCYDDETHLQF